MDSKTPSSWSSERPEELSLRSCYRRGSRARIACYRRNVTYPGLRGHFCRLGGAQGRCSLYLLDPRFHHGYRRDILHRPVCRGHDLVPRDRRIPVTPYSHRPIFCLPVGWMGDTWQVRACEFNRNGTGISSEYPTEHGTRGRGP